jgi:hypothetical protein
MATRIQVRRDTAANWTTNNPTLANGEIGFETNSGRFKIGNGSSAWSALDYFLDSSDLLAYLTAASASTTYLTQASASTTYLTQASASNTYITQLSASTTYATKSELSNIDLSSASAAAVTAIVDSAPETLNTLNELAAALGDDANFASTVTTSLGNKLDTSTASSTYLTQASASSTYLTQASASATYATIGSGGGSSGSAGLIAHLAADNLSNTINTVSRLDANSSLTINSGTLYLSHFTPQVNLTIGRISMQPINYPSSNPTYAKLCIYSIAEDNVTMTLIASTENLSVPGQNFFMGNSTITRLFTSPVNLVAGQRYAAGFLTVGATGTGSLKATPDGQNGSGMLNLFPVISTQWTSQSVLPDSLTIPAGYSAVKTLTKPWFYLEP